MPNSRISSLHAAVAVAAIALASPPSGAQATTPSAAASQPQAPLSAAQRRALLMDPSRPFWKSKASDTAVFEMETSRGTLTIELLRSWAPFGVDRFYNLARAGFFDDSRFYRVLPFYIAQFGHPASPAVGAVWRERKLRVDSVRTSNVRGTVTFAQFNPRDRSTTLFINLNDNVSLDSLGFAPIGRVTHGMEFADAIYAGYGELPSSPAPVGNPRRFYAESNRFLDKAYPKLDRIISIRLRQDSTAHD